MSSLPGACHGPGEGSGVSMCLCVLSLTDPLLVPPVGQLQAEAQGQGGLSNIVRRDQLPKVQRLTQNTKKWILVLGGGRWRLWAPARALPRRLIPDPDRVRSPPCIVGAFALQMLRKLFKNQNRFFPKKPEQKERTTSLDLANNLCHLTPFKCVNAQALTNSYFGIGAVEHRPWANFTLANE